MSPTEYIDNLKIPTNRAEALEAYAGLMALTWGEKEGDFVRKNERRSFGLLMNALAYSEANEYGDRRKDLVAAANKALTRADWKVLRQGG
jgi:hypothetical protein